MRMSALELREKLGSQNKTVKRSSLECKIE